MMRAYYYCFLELAKLWLAFVLTAAGTYGLFCLFSALLEVVPL